jgi:cold shock protein
MTIARGRLDRWFEAKGFGFILCDDGAGDIFCHAAELEKSEISPRTVRRGEVFEFDIEQTPRGPRAAGRELAARRPAAGARSSAAACRAAMEQRRGRLVNARAGLS